jgi:hypothetical protein
MQFMSLITLLTPSFNSFINWIIQLVQIPPPCKELDVMGSHKIVKYMVPTFYSAPTSAEVKKT